MIADKNPEPREAKLKMLFDFQRFERNARLEALIAETESRCAQELSDDSLTLVSAAGEADRRPGESSAVPGDVQYRPSGH